MLSKSVQKLGSITELRDISQSTSDLLTGKAYDKSALKQKIKTLGATTDVSKKRKSESKSSLITRSQSEDHSITSVRYSSTLNFLPLGVLGVGVLYEVSHIVLLVVVKA